MKPLFITAIIFDLALLCLASWVLVALAAAGLGLTLGTAGWLQTTEWNNE